MNARIIDTFSKNHSHEAFNSALLSICSSVFDKVEYVCSPTCRESVKELLNHYGKQQDFEHVKFNDIRIIQLGKLDKLMRERIRLLQDLVQLLRANKKDLVIYSGGGYAIFLFWINIFSFLFRRNVWVFCHGEVENLLLKYSSYKFYKVGAHYKQALYRWILKYGIINKRMRLCVLGNSILANLQPYLNRHNKKRFVSISHPFIFSKQQNEQPRNKFLKIGTIGGLNEEKGLSRLLYVAKQLKGEVELSVVGAVSEPVDYEKYAHINFLSKNKGKIPRKKFDEEVQSLDYVLFLYSAQSYKFIASGALLDAINIGKPIIALHNDFFDDTLKMPVGYLFDTTDKIVEQIQTLNQNYPNNPDYSAFLQNIEKLKNIYSIENITKQFKQEIKAFKLVK